jgi:hypothetical protein
MNKDQFEYLSKKIVQITNHIQRQVEDRKVMLAGYNSEINAGKKRVIAMAKAVEIDSIDPLNEIMGEFEIAEFEKIGRSNG